MLVLKKIMVVALSITLPTLATAGSFSGFASVGVGKTNQENAKLIDYDATWSGRSDSLIGLQFNHNLTPKLDVTLQVLSRALEESDRSEFQPVVDWLFASYQLTPDLRLRLGRLRTPLFLNSEIYTVGYAYPWARPPLDVYSQPITGVSNYDGIHLSFMKPLEFHDLEMALYLGQSEKTILGQYIDMEVLIGGHVELSGDFTTFRYSFLTGKATQVSPESGAAADLILAFASVDPIIIDIANQSRLDNKWYKYHALGAHWDAGNWQITAEANITIPPSEGLGSNIRGGYLSLSRALGQFRPYVVMGHFDFQLNDRAEQLIFESYNRIPPGQIAGLDVLRLLTLEGYRANDYHGRSSTLGIRYDFHTNAAIKAEFQYFETGTHLSVLTSNAIRQESVHLSTIILEVIF